MTAAVEGHPQLQWNLIPVLHAHPTPCPLQMLQAGQHPVVVVKGARVGDYNGKTLSTLGSSTLLVDPPDIAEAGRERNW